MRYPALVLPRSWGSSSASHRIHDSHGLALIATLLVLTLIGVVSAFVFSSAISSLRTSLADYQHARTFYAAEAAAEGALAQLEDRLRDGVLSDGDLASITPPELEPFSFDGFRVERVGEAEVEPITDGPYAGLYALTQQVEIFASAEDPTGAASAVILAARAQAIPLFQFGVFFEKDLEATNGPPMEFIGRVHSNGDIYLSSANAWYRQPITTPARVFHRRKDRDESLDGVYIDDAEENEKPLNFDSETITDPETFKQRSCDQFDCRLMTGAFGVEPLNLPFPEGVTAYELLRPRDQANDDDGERQVKFAWNADTRVIVDLTDVNITGPCGSNMPAIVVERDERVVPSAGAVCEIFDWTWSAFFDGRENELKDVLDIDVEELEDWIDDDPDREINLIYVEFEVPEDGISRYPAGAKDRVLDGFINPAIRMVEGEELPNPLTVASEWPMYTLGDYNSDEKKPAALAGDGITILSTDWEDDENAPNNGTFQACRGRVSHGQPCRPQYENFARSWRNRKAGETTVNAAFLAGHWATPCDWKLDSGCRQGYEHWYGGGLENFPRFLEEWRKGRDRVIFHYRGALVSPFTSDKTDGTWSLEYYVPPQRDWLFDTDFTNPDLLPPGTPNVGQVLRAAFREAL